MANVLRNIHVLHDYRRVGVKGNLLSKASEYLRSPPVCRNTKHVMGLSNARCYHPGHMVLTLRPEKLAEAKQQLLDISKVKKVYIRTRKSGVRSSTIITYGRVNNAVPFPENTRGVLYYHQPPHKPDFDGEVRFRLCDNIDSFRDGRDLLNKDGGTWKLATSDIQSPSHTRLRDLRQMLFDEKLCDRHLSSLDRTERNHILRTLRPEKMVETGQRIVDLAGYQSFKLHFTDSDTDRLVVSYMHLPDGQGNHYAKFPEDAQGVFYYHAEPGQPSIASGVRFRICKSPAQFHEGRDLPADGSPWHLSLYYLGSVRPVSHNLTPLRRQLIREGLVDAQLFADIAKLPPCSNIHRNCLYSLEQPMAFDLSQAHHTIHVISRHSRAIVRLPPFFIDFSVKKGVYTTPYTGRVLARMELSATSEDPRNARGPRVVLRVLDILEPITCVIKDYNYYIPMPNPGELILGRRRYSREYIPRSFPLSRSSLKMLIKALEPSRCK